MLLMEYAILVTRGWNTGPNPFKGGQGPLQVKIAFDNLTVNAIQFMEYGGTFAAPL